MSTPFVDHWRTQGAPEARRLWDMVDGPMPRGLLGLGDPDVHHIDGRWTMFLGGFWTRFRNNLYQATLVEDADLRTGRWEFDRDPRGRVAALVPDPPRGAWDAGGVHTPSYVPATAAHGARIYYTGRATSKQYGPRSRYSIGVLEKQARNGFAGTAPSSGDTRRVRARWNRWWSRPMAEASRTSAPDLPLQAPAASARVLRQRRWLHARPSPGEAS